MGCSSSSCTPKQKDDVFRIAVVEMLVLCVEGAVNRTDEIHISEPQDKKQRAALRKLIGDLRSSDSMSEHDERQVRAATVPITDGNVIAAVFARARELAGLGGGGALATVANGLENSVSALSRALTRVAKQILQKNRAEVLKLLLDSVQVLRISSPVYLVRGSWPHGPAQYKSCRSDAIAAFYMSKAGFQLRKGMHSIVGPAFEHQSVTKAWRTFSERVNEANSTLARIDQFKSTQVAPPKEDVPSHLAEQMVEQLGVLMGQEEKELRADPVGKSRRPQTFAACFGGVPSLAQGLPRACYEGRFQ